MQELLTSLNEAQKEAVTHKNGPLMIVAGAGTGKTRVITERIAWLIQKGLADSSQILALTFTEKAAGEMEERVDLLLPIGYLDLSIHTFHAFCERVLREYGTEIGLARDFRVLTEVDSWLLTRRYFDRFELGHYKPLGNPTRYLRGLLKHFATLKEQQVWPKDYLEFVKKENNDDEAQRLGELARAYETYENLLHELNALDFGGLILYTLKLLRERPNVLKELQTKYKYILVDEFQDTNSSQYELVKLIAEPDNNLTVVGDDDQSIYKFRGASLSNILKFDEDYPETKHVVLTTNYRSHQEILDHAYDFIQKNNPNRLETKTGLSKKLKAHKSTGGAVERIHEVLLEDEAKRVVDTILESRKKDKTLNWKDVGVLVRANDHAESFIHAFERFGVPYQFLAMRGLYTQPAILDILAWLRIIDDPFDSVSSYRVFNHPMWELETLDLQRLTRASKKQGKQILMLNLSEIDDLSDEAKNIYERVRSLREDLSDLARRKRATEILILTAGNVGLVEYINSLGPAQTRDTFRLMQQFYIRVKQFESRSPDRSLYNFLEEFEQEQNAGETGGMDFDIETGPDTVRVMTIHGSKGLEFRHVYVVNLVDRRFPSQNRQDSIPIPNELVPTTQSAEHLEEERRLFYVAMTRAKEKLFLTSAEDYGGKRKKKLSVFLHELGFDCHPEPAEESPPFNEIASSQAPRKDEYNETPIFQIPKHFSFTQFQAYRTCPLQYKFAHALRIPVIGKYQMSFGKTMHGALQLFFENWLKIKKIPELEVMLEAYDSSWIDDWYQDDEQRETYRTDGLESLKEFYKELKINTPKPLAVEQSFTLKVGGVIMKGQIDRVDEFEDGLHLIDYKTGGAKTLDKLRSEQKDQLYIYQMAAEEIWNKPVKKLSYYYLSDNSTVDFLGAPKDLKRVCENIKDVIENLKEERFEAKPGMHCGFCDFANICEFRKS